MTTGLLTDKMIENNDTVSVKIYGALRHCNFMEMDFPKKQLISGSMISIEEHPYKIVSIIETSPEQYSINVMLQEYN
ncbi:MAG: hypothetical protein HQM14_01495 [SAR324 cluster bacterium]|nr:hypothetical protein [SAR324 cluster bacterium]